MQVVSGRASANDRATLVSSLPTTRSRHGPRTGPALERIDALLIPSALGTRPDTVHWKFAPLWKMTETQAATTRKTKAETAKIYADTGLVPLEPLARAVQNDLIEDGALPGLEAALEEFEAKAGLEEPEDPDAAPDPSEMEGDGGAVAAVDLPSDRQAPRPVGDSLSHEERRTVLDRLWAYLTGEPGAR